jgi:hypothetical protein
MVGVEGQKVGEEVVVRGAAGRRKGTRFKEVKEGVMLASWFAVYQWRCVCVGGAGGGALQTVWQTCAKQSTPNILRRCLPLANQLLSPAAALDSAPPTFRCVEGGEWEDGGAEAGGGKM